MKVAFVFPGQGAQSVGMGRDLYAGSSAARAAFDTIDAAWGGGLASLCFEGPEEALRETRNTQPALYAVSLAAFAACAEAGLSPSAVAGHSIGEYAALYAAGCFDAATGLRLVKARAAAMAEAAAARPGAMAAVLGLDASLVAAVCAETPGSVVAANDNAPGQVVLSGEAAAVEAASAALKERGARRVVPLAVSGAFHSPLMEPAAQAMRIVLETTPLGDPQIPLVANVTADYVRTAEAARACLVAQVAGPVRWVETIARLVADGCTAFVECGPGAVLAGLIKRIAPETLALSVGDTASLARAVEALKA